MVRGRLLGQLCGSQTPPGPIQVMTWALTMYRNFTLVFICLSFKLWMLGGCCRGDQNIAFHCSALRFATK